MGTRVRAAVALAALVAVALSACSGTPQATPPPASPTLSSTASPSPTPSPSPTASPTPTPAPTPTPTPIPTPTPTPVSEQVVLARFNARFIDAQPDFHIVSSVEADLLVGGEASQLTITIEGDVSGDDFSGTMVMQLAGVSYELDMIIIGDQAYVRPVRGEWSSGEDFEQTQPLNPFTGDAVSAFSYRGSEMFHGFAVHELSAAEWLGESHSQVLRAAGVRRGKVEASPLDVYVDDEGTPIIAFLDFTVQGRVSGEQVHFAYDVTYEFSEVGTPVTIEAPV